MPVRLIYLVLCRLAQWLTLLPQSNADKDVEIFIDFVRSWEVDWVTAVHVARP